MQHAGKCSLSIELIYNYNGLSNNKLFAYNNNMNEICPKTKKLFWF